MKLKKVLAASVIAAASLFTGASQAAQLDYLFGDLLSGDGPATANFAKLTVNTGNNAADTWGFYLHSIDLEPFFGSQSFFAALAVDGIASGVKITAFDTDSGITEVGFQKDAGGPGGNFDFRFDLMDGKERLESGEFVKWSATGISSISSYAAHIRGIGHNGEDSGWYTPGDMPAPIPLPAAFWLVASALIGFTGWRRYGRATKDVSFTSHSPT